MLPMHEWVLSMSSDILDLLLQDGFWTTISENQWQNEARTTAEGSDLGKRWFLGLWGRYHIQLHIKTKIDWLIDWLCQAWLKVLLNRNLFPLFLHAVASDRALFSKSVRLSLWQLHLDCALLSVIIHIQRYTYIHPKTYRYFIGIYRYFTGTYRYLAFIPVIHDCCYILLFLFQSEEETVWESGSEVSNGNSNLCLMRWPLGFKSVFKFLVVVWKIKSVVVSLLVVSVPVPEKGDDVNHHLGSLKTIITCKHI